VSVAALLAALLALGSLPQATPPAGASAAATEDLAQRLERWRDLLELDLARELLAEGRAAVQTGGALEREGQAVALVARALFESGEEPAAAELLALTGSGVKDAGWIELERARQCLERDELELALGLLVYGKPQPAPIEGTPPPHRRELPESYFLIGSALARAGRAPQAVGYLEAFLKQAPLHLWGPRAWHLLGQAAFQSGNAARGRECAERERELGAWRAFLRVRKLQVREQPLEPLPRLGLAQVWMQAGDFARGRTVLAELTGLAPGFAQGWFHLGECERKLAEGHKSLPPKQAFAAAETAYARALELDPELDLARYNRAVIALLSGEAERARPELERLVDGPRALEPKLLGAHLALARLLLARGENDQAQARFQKYVELGGREKLAP
jgi:tetratricopeptide (TPR) repeat protein